MLGQLVFGLLVSLADEPVGALLLLPPLLAPVLVPHAARATVNRMATVLASPS
jgi:hypothetical protein